MHLYQVQIQGKTAAWAGSMAECREAKKSLMEEGKAEKPSHIIYEETNVPVDKPGLLEFLNENCVQ